MPPSYVDGAEVVLKPLDQRRPLPRDGNSARASLWEARLAGAGPQPACPAGPAPGLIGPHGRDLCPHYVVGDLRAWGWVMTIFGAVQLLAALGVWAGNQLARWFAVAVVGLNAIAQMFFIPAYPFWSVMIIAVDIVALWGLCAYGSRENLGVA